MSTELSPVPSIARIHDQLRSAPGPRVPSLHCPFEPAIHPEFHALQTASVAWAEARGLCTGDTAKHRLGASKIACLVARAHPSAPRDRVQIAADWTTLFCLLDDHIERLESADAVDRALTRVLLSPEDAAAATSDPFCRAITDLRARLRAIASPSAMARVEAAWAELADAFRREAALRTTRQIPALMVYLRMREVTVGIPVELAIGEIVEGIDLDASQRERGPLRALARAASNLVGWSNDVYTFEKELREGETCNLVAVVAQARGTGIHESVLLAAAMHDAEARRFAAALDDLEWLDDAALGYARLLRCWVRGHLDWAHETGRYVP